MLALGFLSAGILLASGRNQFCHRIAHSLLAVNIMSILMLTCGIAVLCGLDGLPLHAEQIFNSPLWNSK